MQGHVAFFEMYDIGAQVKNIFSHLRYSVRSNKKKGEALEPGLAHSCRSLSQFL